MSSPRSLEKKLIPFEKLEALSKDLHQQGLAIVTTNGCFDLLHLGHIKYLLEARKLGDLLICGVNSDQSVKRIKGSQRPLVDEKTRALQIAGIESVDYVTLFGELTPHRFLELIKPAIHVKGGDYRPEDLPERSIVEASGGRVVCIPFIPGFSSTALIEKIKQLS